jgi:hypothetical protein
MADILKVDLKLTTLEQRAALVKKHGPWRCRMLAEKVENHAEFVAARDQGFVYFQGYYLRRPEMMTTHDVPANALNYMRMLQAVSGPNLDVPELDKLIKTETSICYRLLRYMNSARFGFKNEIHSVRHALAILGDREVRRWVRLIATVGAGQDKTSDLVLCALVRARFGELLTPLTTAGLTCFSWACSPCSMSCSNCPCPRFWRKSRWIPKPKPFFAVSPACSAPFTSSCWLTKVGSGKLPGAFATASISTPTLWLLPTGRLSSGPERFPAEREDGRRLSTSATAVYLQSGVCSP